MCTALVLFLRTELLLLTHQDTTTFTTDIAAPARMAGPAFIVFAALFIESRHLITKTFGWAGMLQANTQELTMFNGTGKTGTLVKAFQCRIQTLLLIGFFAQRQTTLLELFNFCCLLLVPVR